MTDRYERIRAALAMGPTPGPWKAHDQSASGWVDITHSAYATPLCYALPHSEPQVDSGHDFKQWVSRAHETPANAAHIAACDPDTIRALLAERDALREALEMMVEMVEMNGFGRDYAMDVARAALHPAAAAAQENDDA